MKIQLEIYARMICLNADLRDECYTSLREGDIIMYKDRWMKSPIADIVKQIYDEHDNIGLQDDYCFHIDIDEADWALICLEGSDDFSKRWSER